MEFTTNLKITSKELFDCLNESIINDVKTFTGKVIGIESIKSGFKYKKDINMNKEHPNWASVEIIDYKNQEYYTISYASNKKKTIVTYQVKDIGNDLIELNYKERLFIRRKDDKKHYQFVEINNNKVDKVPLFKRIQFSSLVKKIRKSRICI